MAVNVNTVYQRVLALANKEQRGYITPQEFNILANQAQLEIFEQYFYDSNVRNKIDPPSQGIGNEEDISLLLDEKIGEHTSLGVVTSGVTFPANYMISKVFLVTDGRECEKLPRNEVLDIIGSARHLGFLTNNPVYCDSLSAGEDIEVYNSGGQVTGVGVGCEIVNTPAEVVFGYTVVSGKALYNAGASTNFDMHVSEETNLVTKIAELAGIILNKPGLVQTFAQQNINETQLKKQ